MERTSNMQKRLGVNSDLNVSQRKDCDAVLHVTLYFHLIISIIYTHMLEK
jgi:hypothetical protein